jgi:pimeloyl-ACP methyl ester carboxylesterase
MTAGGEAPAGVTKLGMPKWGLSMREGKVVDWLVAEGDEDAALRQLSAAMYPSGRQTTVLAGDLDRLTVPVLAVWGSQDRVLPAAQAEPLRARGRVEVLADTGHCPHMEAANEVNRLLGGFLDDLEEQPR